MSDFRSILKQYWGYPGFRPLQEDIIRSVYEGHDTLGLMPTGGGKSITFQVPALAMEGLCLVITPLIALMKDQAENLKKKGIKAATVHSGMSREEIDFTIDNCIYGDFRFLYLSPERLTTDLFRVRLEKMKISFVTIDEAHCISQWGYDFRPSYLRIAELREFLADVPFLALTATATPEVVDDIMDKLQFREKNVFRKSFIRKNLSYKVITTDNKDGKLPELFSFPKGSGIVYVRSRRKTKEISDFLKKKGISADYYHAGLSHELRNLKQEEWQKGKTRVIVSTNAFGMGIDKPDVRLVAHYDLPDSPEAYFQEAGRAGRDEKEAKAILLYNESDRRLAAQRLSVTFPELSVVRDVYHALGNYLQVPVGSGKGQSYDFLMPEFLSRFHFNALVAYNSLLILQREGYIELTEEVNNPSRVFFKVHRDDLYKFQVSNARFDGFIKLLLRSYSGFFSDYVAIDENLLARRAALKYEDVYTYLSLLQKAGIITYIPRKKNPLVIYIEERLDRKNLLFSHEVYDFLKKGFEKRLGKMLQYAGTDQHCRSRMLTAYFGEKTNEDCGVCDVCTAAKQKPVKGEERKAIEESLRSLLTQSPCDLNSMVKAIDLSEHLVIAEIRILLEQGKIREGGDGRFEWRGGST